MNSCHCHDRDQEQHTAQRVGLLGSLGWMKIAIGGRISVARG